MAGFGWNMRQENMHDLNNHARNKRPFPATQIACRICDQVFLTTQALINHIETHMVEDETAASRRQSDFNLMPSQTQRDHHQFRNPNFPQNNFPSLTPLQPQNRNEYISQPLPERTNNVVLPKPSRRGVIWDQFPVPPLQFSSPSRKHFVFGPQLLNNNPWQRFTPMQRLVMEDRSSSDLTKPFIDQLEKAIPDVVKPVETQDYDNNNGVSDAEMLDLTLKL